jgi:F1F0 ATPase subunit 2
MTMTETLTMLLAGLAGTALGILYFGGLWWTLRKALWSNMPALWFMGSLLVRMTIALAGFYVVSNHHWERLLACLLGFVMARLIVTRFTRSANQSSYLGQEGNHAPYSR